MGFISILLYLAKSCSPVSSVSGAWTGGGIALTPSACWVLSTRRPLSFLIWRSSRSMTWSTAAAGSTALAWARTSRDLVVTVTSTVWASGTRGLRSSENSTSIARIRSSKRWTLASFCLACARSFSGTSMFLPFTVTCMGCSQSDRRHCRQGGRTHRKPHPPRPPARTPGSDPRSLDADRLPFGRRRSQWRDSTHSKHGSTRQYDRHSVGNAPLTSEVSTTQERLPGYAILLVSSAIIFDARRPPGSGRTPRPRRAECGAGRGEDGDLDFVGARLTQGCDRPGEGTARRGDVVDQEDAAAREALPDPRRRPGGRLVRPVPVIRVVVPPVPPVLRVLVIRLAPLVVTGMPVTAGTAQVPTGCGREQAGQRQVERCGNAGRDLLGVVPWQSACGPRRDPGDQIGANARGEQQRAEAAPERPEGGRLPAELPCQHGRSQDVAVEPERPQRHGGVGGQAPRPGARRLGRQAGSTARPGVSGPAGEAIGRSQQPAERGEDQHAKRLPGRTTIVDRLSTALRRAGRPPWGWGRPGSSGGEARLVVEAVGPRRGELVLARAEPVDHPERGAVLGLDDEDEAVAGRVDRELIADVDGVLAGRDQVQQGCRVPAVGVHDP